MNYYISNGTFYAVPKRTNELYHYGVPGMKWGRRKARPVANSNVRRTSGATSEQQAAQREARKAKAKKALKIGAAVAGTALAAYGAYKLAKYVQGKRSQAAMQKAQAYIDKNVYRKWGDTTFTDGTRMMDFRDGMGNEITTRGSRNAVGKAVGQHNAKVVATGRRMYNDATNTRLDRGLAKVVNTGDAVGNAVKTSARNAGNAIKTSANKAKNAVLDVVNPIYEYTPKSTTSTYRDAAGIDWTETVTNYYKTRKKRT